MPRRAKPPPPSANKFNHAERELECTDDDEKLFDERASKLAKRKPVEKPE